MGGCGRVVEGREMIADRLGDLGFVGICGEIRVSSSIGS
jgi:hypothetical protein